MREVVYGVVFERGDGGMDQFCATEDQHVANRLAEALLPLKAEENLGEDDEDRVVNVLVNKAEPVIVFPVTEAVADDAPPDIRYTVGVRYADGTDRRMWRTVDKDAAIAIAQALALFIPGSVKGRFEPADCAPVVVFVERQSVQRRIPVIPAGVDGGVAQVTCYDGCDRAKGPVA